MKYYFALLLCAAMSTSVFVQAQGVHSRSDVTKEPMAVVVDKALKHAEAQSLRMAAMYATQKQVLPRSFEKGKNTVSDAAWWTSGFFPGVLWYLYENSHNPQLLNHALDYTARVEKEKFTTNNHDIGFMLYCSFGNGLRINGQKGYEEVLLTGASSLSKRYKDHIGLIRSWDFHADRWQYPVIIDNMMNLELLMWAADRSGNKRFREIAMSHADKTLKHHYRPDHSCYHVVSYDSITGHPHVKQTHQGYSDASSWARGQGWGLYGFTMMYRFTHKPEYLEHACKIADYMINHPRMPQHMIPYWDYDAPRIPNEPYDSSTASLMASALIELSGYVADKGVSASYLQIAERQLRSLASEKFTAKAGENGNFILLHGTGNLPANSEVDAPLTYGDYYYVEALMRWKMSHQDSSLSFEKRAADLVSRMTLEEKVGQMNYESPAIERLGIPEYNWWNECLHGVGRTGLATVFPQAIGMAAMWDSSKMYQIATVVSDEARAKHHQYAKNDKRRIYQGLTYWTPNINIFRDPRWGRGMETYGEDPYLTGELAVQYIKGLQGDDPKYLKLVATAKHFAVHSGPESTRHSADVRPSNRDLAETYFPHFEKTVKESDVWSVMCAYQRFEGMPCCGSQFLENKLRNVWGFSGYIVSDCWAVRDFYQKGHHEVVKTAEEAAVMAVRAGTDLNCGDTYPALLSAVQKGLIAESELDVSVKRLMMARLKLGMFDSEDEVPYARIPYEVVDSEKHQHLALDAARKSLVLLKNEGVLPLSKELKKVAVIGPNSDDLDVLLANYNGWPSNPKTPLQGIREKLPQAKVSFAQGCELATNLPYLTAVPSDVLHTDATKSQQGMKASYFANTTFEGLPKHRRTDENIDFRWWTNPPCPHVSNDAFSVRWEGVLTPPMSGNYALGVEGFTSITLYVNGEQKIHYKSVDAPHKEYVRLDLEGGKDYEIKVEYCQDATDYPMARLLWDTPKKNLAEEAVELARNSDVAILCMGLSPRLEGEEMKVNVEGFAGGDRVDIKLPFVQTELIRKIHETGTPTILVLLNGSAIAFNWETEHLPAILEAWYPGQAGGTAIADILFGDYNPSGRLPVTFYKSIDQLPSFDNYDMKGKTYRYFTDTPLFPFGHGLSYSSFKYGCPELSAKVMKSSDNVSLRVELLNDSKVDGVEVVQLYVRRKDDPDGPLKSLRGFRNVSVGAGCKETVEFRLNASTLESYDAEAEELKLLPGCYEIMVGGSSSDKNLQKLELKVMQ